MDYPIDTAALQAFVDATHPTQTEKCAELARAMGWTSKIEGGRFNQRKTLTWYSPTGSYSPKMPDPFISHSDCHALMVWMAEDETRRHWFLWCLCTGLDVTITIGTSSRRQPPLVGGDDYCLTREQLGRLLTADPAVKAEAAWRAIQEKQ